MYEPPYCYYEYNELKFNDGGNTGPCTDEDQCLCVGAPPEVRSPPEVRYQIVQSGTCQTHGLNVITNEDECANAGRDLLNGLSVTSYGGNGESCDPPYCYFEHGDLKFNRNGRNTGLCTEEDQCLCVAAPRTASPTAPPTAPPTSPPTVGPTAVRYQMVRSGTCQTHGLSVITNEDECANAGRDLLNGLSVKSYGGNGESCDPPYCYFENGDLKFNRNGRNTGQCAEEDQCLCVAAPRIASPTAPPTSPPIALGTAVQYQIVRSGTCQTHGLGVITSEDECANAGRDLLNCLSVTSYEGNSATYDPPYCYFEQNALKFNKNGANTGPCTEEDQCLCVSATRTASPIPAPTAPPTAPPTAIRCHLVRSGTCQTHGLRVIYTPAECADAAKSLALAVTSVTSYGQDGMYEPPYCYYESGDLKFNNGGNTGDCTEEDQCLCCSR